jgi:hypothetical protein
VQRSAALAPEEEEGIVAVPKFIDIDGKRFAWRDLLQRRREQLVAAAKVEQPVLFELKEIVGPRPSAPPADVTVSRACSR